MERAWNGGGSASEPYTEYGVMKGSVMKGIRILGDEMSREKKKSLPGSMYATATIKPGPMDFGYLRKTFAVF